MDKLVDDFRQAMLEVWQRDGKTTWPIDLNSVAHLFVGDFDQELLADIEALQRQGLGKREIARLFVIPQRVIRLIMPFVQGMSALGTAREQRAEQVRFLLSLADEIKYGDPSNRDGRNLVLSPQQADEMADARGLACADNATARLVHVLCGVLWAYSETLFFKTHGLVREFHGPYPGRDADRKFLVRDFVCLQSVEIWPESEALDCSSVRVICEYRGLDMSIDIYNHVSIPEGEKFVDSLCGYRVECDAEPLGPPQIELLCRELSVVMGEVSKRVEAMDWAERAEKYAEIFWYSKKNLRDRLGQDWRLPDATRRKIHGGNPKTRRGEMSEKELRMLLKLSF